MKAALRAFEVSALVTAALTMTAVGFVIWVWKGRQVVVLDTMTPDMKRRAEWHPAASEVC